MDQFIQGEESDLVEDVVPDLELVGVLDPDAKRLELAVEPVLVPSPHSGHPRYSRTGRRSSTIASPAAFFKSAGWTSPAA